LHSGWDTKGTGHHIRELLKAKGRREGQKKQDFMSDVDFQTIFCPTFPLADNFLSL
jgi:hypothetical protein